MDFKDQLHKLLKKEVKSDFNLEIPPDPSLGDFALPCFSLAKELKKSPVEIASELGNKIKADFLDRIEIKGPYLNFFLKKASLITDVIPKSLEKDYGKEKQDKNILIEFPSPNTNKPLHLGHIRNNVLGVAMANLFQSQGAAVTKVSVVNDRGIHITKSMVAYKRWGEGKTPAETGEKGDHFVGRFYVLFEKEFEREWQEFAASHPEITNFSAEELAKRRQEFFGESVIGQEAQVMLRAWDAEDKSVRGLWQQMNQWVYDGFAATYKVLGSIFDKEYYESQTYLLGKAIVKSGLEQGIFEQQTDGSVWVDLTAEGLDRKILQRHDGTSVYITQDLGLACERQKEFNFDRLIYVVGHEQEYHFKVLFLIMKKLGFAWADKLRHLSYGLVFLPEGKMKSREGKVVDADDIIAEVKSLAFTEIKKRDHELSESEVNSRAQAIGVGALKFFLLRVTPTQAIHYNPAEAIAFEGATGPYIQYAQARIASILTAETPLAPDQIDFAKLESPEEKNIILKLLSYPQAVQQAATTYSPNVICDYLVGLSQAFNTFYHKHQVLRAADSDTKYARLLLSKAVQIVLRNGLNLLGMESPEEM
ncbi:MAG: arginine--tRNA ligase [Candidatus Komeilibacteria bacterium]|nr:arginine--tRNA ligase [Candidatus Komeilibacteria bacterium]